MKTIKINLALVLIAILVLANTVLSQDKSLNRSANNVPVKSLSDEEMILAEKIHEKRIAGDKEGVISLQKKLHEMNGVTSYESEAPIPMQPVTNSSSTSMSASEVFSLSNVKAIGTATEQRGPNTGRIWAVALYDYNGNASTMTSYSDDDGVNWTQFSFGTLSNYLVPNYNGDRVDLEIIENFNGAKYLHFVFGTRYYLNDKNVCWLGSLNIGFGTFSGYYHRLSWMGFNLTDASAHYVFPRITSDNAFYHDIPWIYISAGFEVHGSQTDFYDYMATITSPFTALPTINYANVTFYPFPIVTNSWFSQNCDIAWFIDPAQTIPGGTIQLIECSQEYSGIYLFQSTAVDYLSGGNYDGYLDGGGTIVSGHIASNGSYYDLMIVYDALSPSNLIYTKYYSSLNSGVTWSGDFMFPNALVQGRSDVVGMRNYPGRFFSSFTGSTPYTCYYRESYYNTWNPVIAPMNHLDADPVVGSAPGFKLNGIDNCFVIWKERNGNRVFATKDCSGNLHQSIRFQVGVLIEGFFRTSTYNSVSDTVTVSLRKFTPPYTVLESKKTVIDPSGNCQANFSEISSTTDYYVEISHRNSIAMWSALPINFGGGTVGIATYTSSNSLAYGNNLKLIAIRPSPYTKYYGLYSGDVNQDELIDGTDLSLIDSDALLFLPPGYYSTDVNGDTVVDGSDISITDNNAALYITVIRP